MTIGDSISSITPGVFYGCSSLSRIYVTSGNSTYDSRNDCNAIIETASNKLIVGCKNTIIPNSVTSIGSSAFSGCTGLNSITIPNSVTSIDGSAFSGCSGLYSVTIGSATASIGDEAFKDCNELTNVTCLATTPPSIYSSTFSNYSNATLLVPYNCIGIYQETNYWKNFSTIRIIPIERDDIYYTITGANTVAVTYKDFNYNSYSGNITIPSSINHNGTIYSVTGIGENAFRDCPNLYSVTFPNSIAAIESNAFYGCNHLSSISIPNSVTSIGDSAFRGCTALKTLYFNAISCANFSSASSSPFYGLNIKTINIGNGVLNIPANFACGLTQLENVTIPNSIISIGKSAFAGCSSLASIVIPSLVTSIDSHTFSGCSGLTSITIPLGVTSIGWCAFQDCAALTSITIPSGVTSIGNSAFQGCSALETLNYNAASCYDFSSSTDYQPFYGLNISTINIGDGVQKIPAYFAYGLAQLANVTIPSSITSIGNCAFRNCSGMTSFTIPSSVTSIGNMAFQGCTSLRLLNYNAVSCSDFSSSTYNQPFYGLNISTINIGDGVQKIPSYFAYGLTELTNVNISNSVTTIGNNAFSKCSLTGTLVIPNSVTLINNSAFSNCTELTAVNIPSTVQTIKNGAFIGCTGLTSVIISDIAAWCNINFADQTANPLHYAHHLYLNGSEVKDLTIPNSVTTIGDYAFYDCYGMTGVSIGNSVTTIGDYAFRGCSRLSSVTIPNSITSIGKNAFIRCTSMTSLNFNAVSCSAFSSTASENPFYDLNLSTISIGNSVQIIPAYFAYGLTNLKNLIIDNNVATIGDCAFNGCSGLTELTIPESVTFIGKQAFDNSPSIGSVTCAAANPPSWADIAMFTTNVYNHSPLYVPMGSVRAYQADQCWGQFNTISGMQGEEVTLATNISLNQSNMYLAIGATSQLSATVLPENATNKTVTWASSNSNVATVDENGLVTALAPGTATITATTTDGSNLSASCSVTVTEYVEPTSNNYFHIDNKEVFHGETIVIPVQMTNEETILAFQTDISLPEGFTVLTDEDDEFLVTPSSRLTSDHVILADQLTDGTIRVICYTPRSKVISGNEGDLFYITVAVPEDAGGDYNILLHNSLLTATDYSELSIGDANAIIHVNTYIPGDVNDSHTVTVTDIVFTAQYIMERNPSPFIFAAADMNGDGNITVTDIMLIARLIMTPTTMNAPKQMPVLAANGDYMSGKDINIVAGETRKVTIALNNVMDYSAFQLDLNLPDGLTAGNFALTDRAGGHTLDVNSLANGNIRALCYSPAMTDISGYEGALLTFDVTATGIVKGDIMVEDIEFVTSGCRTVLFNAFAIGVNNSSIVNEMAAGKTISKVEYFNLAGQQMEQPTTGVVLVVTTYTDGTRSTSKIIR